MKRCWSFVKFADVKRYRYKKSNKNQIETDGRWKYTEDERRCALMLFLEGNRFRRIARIMNKFFGKNYKHQTIMNWIKSASLKILKEKSQQEQIDVTEMDELYTYVKKRSKNMN